MNVVTFEKLLGAWYNKSVELHRRKGHDYATEDDMLANFKRMHKVCKLYDINPAKRPGDVFWFYMFIKIDRLRNILQAGKDPECEAVSDSYDDLVLYTKLLMAFNVEQAEGLTELLTHATANRPSSRCTD